MEVWTAVRKETEDDRERIIFEVEDTAMGETREESRFLDALPLIFTLGGYNATMGMMMMRQPLPWSFRKHRNGMIYLNED